MPTREGPYAGTDSKDPIRRDKTTDSSGNPVDKSRNLNLDKVLDHGASGGSSKLPKDAR